MDVCFSDNSPSSKHDAKQLIQKIRDYRLEQRSAIPDDELAKFRRMEERILESLDDASQVIPELLQNADDVGGSCTEVTLRLTDDELVVINHDECMTEAEIAALGEFTRSTKRDLSYIGHFGIGFKTVFSVTNSPHIETGHASFKYDQSDSELPVTVSGEYVDGTRVRLPFSDGLSETRQETLKSRLESIDRLLPFLNNLETIRVEFDDETRVYERIETDSGIRTIKERLPEDNFSRNIARYRLFSQTLTTDSEVFEMLSDEREFNAADLKERNVELEVTVAIPVSDEGTPVSHQDSRLFCYFPAGNDTSLPFDVQADFLLKSNREEIRPGHPLNERFLSVAGKLVETAISEFKTDDVAPRVLLELVPDLTEDRPAYLDPLIQRTTEVVSDKQIIPTASGDVCRPTEVVIVPEDLRPILPLDEFAQAYPNAEGHPEKKLDGRYYERLDALERTQSLSMVEVLEQLSDMNILQNLEMSDIIKFLAAVEKYLDSLRSYRDEEKEEIEQIITALKSLPIFSFQGRTKLDGRHPLTEAGDTIYRPARQDESVYEAFYDELDLLSGDLVAELRSSQTISDTKTGRVQDLLTDRLGIEELTHRDIVRDVINEAFSSPIELPDETLDDYLEYVRDHAQRYIDDCEIKLRASDGTYVEPESLYLPTAYNEGRYCSTLLFSTLTDKKPVSEFYLNRTSNQAETNTEDWRTFFVDLGVQNYIPVSKDADQCNKETFQSAAEIHEFLDEHDDEGTDVRKDKDTVPYGGRSCSWMRSTEARHGLVDWAFSSSFEEQFQNKIEETPELGAEFAKMLDAYWEDIYQDAAYREYYFSVSGNGYATRTESSKCPTTFTHFLRSNEWLPGEDGELYQARHLFEHNSVTKRADVTLLAESVADISPELRDLLNVRDDVGTTEHKIGIEQAAAERTEREADEVDSEIRSHLHSLADQIDTVTEEEKSQLADELQDCPFIYIPEATPEFRTPDQVAWSEGLGEYIVPINTYYRGLHELLVEILGIPPEPTLDTYIEFFQYGDEERWSAIEEAWREVVRRVVRNDSLEQDAADIATKFKETDSIPNANKSLVPYSEIKYVARREGMTERLPDSIADTVVSPSYDQRFNRDEIISSLTMILDADPLGETMEQTVTSPAYEGQGLTLYDEFAQGLEVGYSVLVSRDAMQAAETLISVADYTLQQTNRITCTYRLKGERRVEGHQETVYIDEEQEHILIKDTEAALLDLVDALAAKLDLTDADKNAFVDFVKGAIGKPPELIDAYLDGEDISRVPITAKTLGSPDSGKSKEFAKRTKEEDRGSVHGETKELADTLDGTSEEINSPEVSEADLGGQPSTVDETDTKQESGARSGTLSNFGGSANKRSDLKGRKQRNQSNSDFEADAPEENNKHDSFEKDDQYGSSNNNIASGLDDLTFSNKSSGGGGGREPGKSGKKGETFVLKQLRDAVEKRFRKEGELKNTLTNSSGQSYTVQGDIGGIIHEITIRDVSQQNLGYDIRLEGATLTNNPSGLFINRINKSETTYVEVKSSKKEYREFDLSPNEYKTAITESPDYMVVRIHTVRSDPAIDRVFYNLPKFFERTADAAIYPNGITVEYNNSP